MKFAMAFSTGKDSMLALHKMVQEGHEPIGLMVMYNSNSERSWFHGTDRLMLGHISKSLEIPLYFGESDGNDYNEVFEATLQKIKDAGAEACVFGDIDLVQHREWDEERCKAVGVKAVLPLWQINRETAVKEVVAAGYKCMIKCVHAEQLPESFLGKVLDESVLEEMKAYGIDICGENGEFHTVVMDVLMFKYPLPYEAGEVLKLQYVSAIELKLKEKKL